MRDDLQLICFPHDDAAFAADVAAVVDAVSDDELDESARLAAVVEALRARYPLIRIRSRDPIASFEEGPPVWYVYRDGRPSSRSDGSGSQSK